MDIVLIFSLAATLFISLLSLIGVFAFMIGDKIEKKISMFFVAFSTGALLGGAFLHLLPESISDPSSLEPYLYLLLGIIIFYLLERLLKWHHCHNDGGCDVHTFTYMSLVGDGIHNFIDGLVIVSAFSVSFEVGLATTIAVASHEVPQELGDFFVLVHGGFSKIKALLWNFASATTAVIGALIGYILINNVENITSFVLPLAAGGFIYVSMSDLIPELHKENNLKKSLAYFTIFIIGLAFMYITKIAFE
ncbi:MAG: ZIP family metal transporter [Candidatus Saccharimonadales bacterium]